MQNIAKNQKQEDYMEEEEDPPWKKDVYVPTTAMEKQRHKLEKLMKRTDRPVFIPERPKEKEPRKPPEFIRHVWGSAWGAGSGDFHIYRGIRRREGIRQKHRDEKAIKEQANEEYQQKLINHKEEGEKRMAKNESKRKRKKRAKQMSKQKKKKTAKEESEDSDDESSAELSDDEPDTQSAWFNQQQDAQTADKQETTGIETSEDTQTSKENEKIDQPNSPSTDGNDSKSETNNDSPSEAGIRAS